MLTNTFRSTVSVYLLIQIQKTFFNHFQVENEGMKLKLSDVMPNTLQSHRILHFAKDFNKQHELAKLLFKLYWLEGKDIGNTGILADAASKVGIDKVKVKITLLILKLFFTFF